MTSEAEVVATYAKILRQETKDKSSMWVGVLRTEGEILPRLIIAESKAGFRLGQVSLSARETFDMYRHLTDLYSDKELGVPTVTEESK